MKTVFLPIYRRQQARNVLRNAAFRNFASQADVRIVIFTAHEKVEQYREEFSNNFDTVIVEGTDIVPEPLSLLDRFFYHLSYFYVDTKMVRHNRARFILHEQKRPIKYAVSLAGITIIGRLGFLRRAFKKLDMLLIKPSYYGEFFDAYHPDVVFVPHLASKIDRMFIRNARRRRIPSIGLVNSWDTITMSKFPIRLLPDILLVHNFIIKQEAVRYLDMPESSTQVIGMPHFDHYVQGARSPREVFFRRIGLDPHKRLILLAPFFTTAWQIADIIQKAILSGELPDNAQLLIREHPAKEMDKGDLVIDRRVTVIEKPVSVMEYKGVQYNEVLKNDMNHLADTLYYSDVTINTCSTMSIDAAAFNKPIINIAFDGYEQPPFYESVLQFYDETRIHYLPILKSGGVRLAHDKDELIQLINRYLSDPHLDSTGRERIVREQCYKLDGKSGERMFDAILGAMK